MDTCAFTSSWLAVNAPIAWLRSLQIVAMSHRVCVFYFTVYSYSTMFFLTLHLFYFSVYVLCCAKALRFQYNKCPICHQSIEEIIEIKINNGDQ